MRWASIEVLTSGRFSRASDVWAFGVLMFEVLSRGALPYAEMATLSEVVETSRHLPDQLQWDSKRRDSHVCLSGSCGFVGGILRALSWGCRGFRLAMSLSTGFAMKQIAKVSGTSSPIHSRVSLTRTPEDSAQK